LTQLTDDVYGQNQEHSTQDSIPQPFEFESQPNLHHAVGTHKVEIQKIHKVVRHNYVTVGKKQQAHSLALKLFEACLKEQCSV
jgi:hypothetical protein